LVRSRTQHRRVSAESKKWLRGESACLNTLERIASWSTV
ncbi:MAG: hypothetical protein RIS76_2964, partial [Verrucomicrobiota bacterium]